MTARHARGPQILVAEDNPLNFELLQEALEMRGLDASWARDGDAALQELQRQAYDILILDLHMPGMDGFQLLEAVRSDARLADMFIMVLTADLMGEIESQVLARGADLLLPKPVDFSSFWAAIDQRLVQ